MFSLNKILHLTVCIYLLFRVDFLQAKGSSSNKFYFEPFLKIDYQVWQNDQLEQANDGNYTYKFRGLYYGPRFGAKVLGIYKSWLVYGFQGSYSYLFNVYSPDQGLTQEAKADDNFNTDSTSSQIQFGVLAGVQLNRFGIKLNYFPSSTIQNNDKYTTFNSTNLTNSYEGSGFGASISYVYRPKFNLYFEYQAFTYDTFIIDDNEYKLPTTSGSMTFKEFTTTKYSFGISMIF